VSPCPFFFTPSSLAFQNHTEREREKKKPHLLSHLLQPKIRQHSHPPTTLYSALRIHLSNGSRGDFDSCSNEQIVGCGELDFFGSVREEDEG